MQLTPKCRGPSKWIQSYLFRLAGLEGKSIGTHSHLLQSVWRVTHPAGQKRPLALRGQADQSREIAFLGSPGVATQQSKAVLEVILALQNHVCTLHSYAWPVTSVFFFPSCWACTVLISSAGFTQEPTAAGNKQGLCLVVGACFTQKPDLGFLLLVLGNVLAFTMCLMRCHLVIIA